MQVVSFAQLLFSNLLVYLHLSPCRFCCGYEYSGLKAGHPCALPHGSPRMVLVTPVAPGMLSFWVLLISLPPVSLRMSHLAAMGLPSPQCNRRGSHLLLCFWDYEN